jgi:hypothetical protein
VTACYNLQINVQAKRALFKATGSCQLKHFLYVFHGSYTVTSHVAVSGFGKILFRVLSTKYVLSLNSRFFARSNGIRLLLYWERGRVEHSRLQRYASRHTSVAFSPVARRIFPRACVRARSKIPLGQRFFFLRSCWLLIEKLSLVMFLNLQKGLGSSVRLSIRGPEKEYSQLSRSPILSLKVYRNVVVAAHLVFQQVLSLIHETIYFVLLLLCNVCIAIKIYSGLRWRPLIFGRFCV